MNTIIHGLTLFLFIRRVRESREGKLNRLKQRLLKGLHDGGEKEKQGWE